MAKLLAGKIFLVFLVGVGTKLNVQRALVWGQQEQALLQQRVTLLLKKMVSDRESLIVCVVVDTIRPY